MTPAATTCVWAGPPPSCGEGGSNRAGGTVATNRTKQNRDGKKKYSYSRFPFTTSTTFSLFSRPSVRGRLLPEKIRETFSVLDSTATENRLGGFVWPEIDAATVKVICTRPPSLDRAVFSPIVWRVTRQNWQVGRVGWRRGRRRDGQR